MIVLGILAGDAFARALTGSWWHRLIHWLYLRLYG